MISVKIVIVLAAVLAVLGLTRGQLGTMKVKFDKKFINGTYRDIIVAKKGTPTHKRYELFYFREDPCLFTVTLKR